MGRAGEWLGRLQYSVLLVWRGRGVHWHTFHRIEPHPHILRIRHTGVDIRREEVPTHSLRVGDTYGEHTVWLCGPGERIELKHVATRREVFAIGALRWARALTGSPPGLQRP